MTDNELIRSCDEALQRERDALADVLRHLREIERRRLFSELTYKSLYDYCVRRLNYSEDQAHRRISAMRLIKQMPEAEEKIEQGTLSLSSASLLQRVTIQCEKPLSREEKLELMSQIENKSRREAERILVDAKTTLHIQVSDETDEKFQKLRGLTAHKYKNVSELFDAMVELAFHEKHGLLPAKSSLAQKQRIMVQAQRMKDKTSGQMKQSEAPQSVKQTETKQSEAPQSAMQSNAMQSNAMQSNAMQSNAKSASLETRPQSLTDLKCTNCGSTHALQTEHIIPRAKGGTDEPSNLTVLCRNCNQRAAIREYGLKKMDRYLNQ